MRRQCYKMTARCWVAARDVAAEPRCHPKGAASTRGWMDGHSELCPYKGEQCGSVGVGGEGAEEAGESRIISGTSEKAKGIASSQIARGFALRLVFSVHCAP